MRNRLHFRSTKQLIVAGLRKQKNKRRARAVSGDDSSMRKATAAATRWRPAKEAATHGSRPDQKVGIHERPRYTGRKSRAVLYNPAPILRDDVQESGEAAQNEGKLEERRCPRDSL